MGICMLSLLYKKFLASETLIQEACKVNKKNCPLSLLRKVSQVVGEDIMIAQWDSYKLYLSKHVLLMRSQYNSVIPDNQ